MSLRRLKARGLGRLELLAWLNELLETDYTKVEHLADGIAYCQMLDALHPGKVSLAQVNFQAKSQAEYERNFRVLRRAFQACEIHKEVPVRKLVEGVFQEHFEFLHWIHDYAHKTYPDAVRKYHGFARRQEVLGTGSGLGSPSLSLASLGHTNMNLVPSYAMSSKSAAGRFALALDIIDPEEVPGDLTLDDLVGLDSDAPLPVDIRSHSVTKPRAKAEGPVDPLLRFVVDSNEATIRADQVLAQLEKTKAMVLDVAPPLQPKAKAKASTTAASKTKTTKPKPQKAPEPSTDPPFLAPQLNQLIDILAQELSGRAKDIAFLDDQIQSLIVQLTSPPETIAQEPTGTP